MTYFTHVFETLVFYSFSCSSNVMATLPEQRNEVTRAFHILMNAFYDETQHVDVLQTASR